MNDIQAHAHSTDIISENHLRAGFDDGKDKRHLSRTNDQEPDTNQPLTNSEDRGYLSSLVTPVKSVVTEVFGDIPKVVEHMKALLVLCANQIRMNEGFHHHNLKITNAEDDFFGHKTYREWANDVLTMFQGDHVVAQYAIILTLTNEHFHADMGVRSMLEKAITLYPIKRELVDLEDAQIKYWADKDMLPSNVFKWLNFNKDNVLDRRLLAQWTAFLTHRHENSLDKDLVDDEKVYEMLIKEMAKMYKTSDLVDIIVKAEKKNPSQPIWKTTAWDYGLALFKTWSSEGKSDEYILSLLRIQTNEEPLKNPLVTLWIHYMKEKKVDPVHLLFPRLHEYYKDPKELENAIAAENIQWQLRAN